MFNTNVITFKSINRLVVITVSDPDPHLVPARSGRYKVVDEAIASFEITFNDQSRWLIFSQVKPTSYISMERLSLSIFRCQLVT